MILPEDPKERKRTPVVSGCLDYFPKSILAIARQSQVGYEQHYTKDEPMEWDR